LRKLGLTETELELELVMDRFVCVPRLSLFLLFCFVLVLFCSRTRKGLRWFVCLCCFLLIREAVEVVKEMKNRKIYVWYVMLVRWLSSCFTYVVVRKSKIKFVDVHDSTRLYSPTSTDSLDSLLQISLTNRCTEIKHTCRIVWHGIQMLAAFSSHTNIIRIG